ncbi:hypothetical protein D3C78_1735330 [compost metagenome]
MSASPCRSKASRLFKPDTPFGQSAISPANLNDRRFVSRLKSISPKLPLSSNCSSWVILSSACTNCGG